MPRYKAVNGSANQNQLFVPDGRKAVNGSANQNLSNSLMKSELNIMHGERRGIHDIQHNTNNTLARQEGSPDTCHQALQSSYYEQHERGARTHAEGARQPDE